jgi:hypothetical protein
MRLDKGFKPVLSGSIYAQPLYWNPQGGPAAVIVATETNIIYALDPVTGAIRWQRKLATPAPVKTLGCGDINPEGVTGTPVIDPKTGTLYVDATSFGGGSVSHLIYALSLATGRVLSGWPLDVQSALTAKGASFQSKYEGERSALLLFGDRVYAVYGGRAGDCAPYHGTVIEVDPARHKLTAYWQTRASKGGIWSQGGIASEGRFLYITTGNTDTKTYGDGESIIALKPGLRAPKSNLRFYAPSNWLDLDQEDADLGGTEALPVNVATGHGGTVPRVIAFGKDGNAYLVDRADMGGIGGKADIVAVSTNRIVTAPAIYSTPNGDMVAFSNNGTVGCKAKYGIMMLSLAPSGNSPITVAWCAGYSGNASPIITTTDGISDPIVWVYGASGDNLLHGFNALNGDVVFKGGGINLAGTQHFGTILAAAGRFYIAGTGTVYALRYTPG